MNEILKMFIDTLHLTNEYLIVKIYFHNKLKKNLKLLTRATQGGIVFSKQANKQYTPGGIHPKPRGNTGKTTFPQTPRRPQWKTRKGDRLSSHNIYSVLL